MKRLFTTFAPSASLGTLSNVASGLYQTIRQSRVCAHSIERRFAKRAVKRLLNLHSLVSAKNHGLSGIALYREILLHSQQIDPSRVERILRQAEDSVDEWTSPGRDGLGFREVVHFFVMSQYRETGQVGTVVSFRDIVDSLVPGDL